MFIVCILLIACGAGIMLYSIIKYHRFLVQLKTQINTQKLFSSFIYLACFVAMLFFLVGYVVIAIVYTLNAKINTHDLLIASIFFFGAIFVIVMVTMVHRMFVSVTDKAELKKRLQQQELMSAISQSFTTIEDHNRLIYDALKMSGEFMGVNHAFLAQYRKDLDILDCLYEWHDEIGHPFVGYDDKWPLFPDMEYFLDLTLRGHSVVSDYKQLTDPHFETVKDHDLGAFLNVPLYISGKFWGILGFIIYHTPHGWSDSDVHLGKLIAGVFSGAIAKNIANEEMIRAKETAEYASKAKSEFLSRMSHEMRTPMNAIIGMTTIGKNAHETNRKDYCFEKILSASSHLLGVINDVLDMSKIEANKLELSYHDFSLEGMLSRIVTIISYQMEEKKQCFRLVAAEDVPKGINSDEQRLSQIITNLLSNAVKFTPSEGIISLFVRRLNSCEENEFYTLEFEVKDTGIGISADQQAKLFSSFEQADGSISRKYGGTGLGLAISKRLVEMMGGTIRVESEAGSGASFIFNIRAGIVPQDHLIESLSDNDGSASKKYSAGCFKDKKILVAEDIEINREIVASLLEFSGIEIIFAENGRRAYETFAANPRAYDMIFMDVHMPEVNGYDATKMIRGIDNPHAKTIPIIAMTADVFREDIEKCLAAGMNDHIGKPLDIDDMLAKINHCAGGEPLSGAFLVPHQDT